MFFIVLLLYPIFSEDFDEIHFFGDKTFEGGNDYEIFTHERYCFISLYCLVWQLLLLTINHCSDFS
jgi:hypothetical protein